MNDLIQSFRPQQHLGLRFQIADYLRSLIAAGRLQPGQQLPPTRELAATWGTHVAGVQGAMTLLVKEGLLWRKPRVGTFVRQVEAQPRSVAIYDLEDELTTPSFGFQPALHARIREILRREGVRVDVWADPRPMEEQRTPWMDLRRAAEERRVQGVIVPRSDWPHIDWLVKLPVPCALCSTGNLPCSVVDDYAIFLTMALDALVARGCRSVGLIASVWPEEKNPDGSLHDDMRAMTAFRKRATQHGLLVREAWLRTPPKPSDAPMHTANAVATTQRYGYDAFRAIWAQSERPEGLVVANDVTSLGVVTAMFEAGVRGGRDLELVLHRNSDVEVFCPMPATLLEYNTPELAEALVEQLRRQWRGEAVEKVYLKPIFHAPLAGGPENALTVGEPIANEVGARGRITIKRALPGLRGDFVLAWT